jgi:diguanylate cyclase (GGDEF)-like protein
LFGYPRAELLAQPLDRLVPRWRAAAISERVTESSAPRETQAVRRDGSTLPVEITTSRVETEHGALVTTILRDVTERKRFEEQLLYLAEHDALTGLLNRRRFERELGDHLARTARAACSGGAVLLLDLDNLKYVNDSLGHTVGDDLIKSVAGVLRTRLRATDVLARLGGDEFAVLLTGATAAQSALVAEDLLTALRGHIVAGGAARVQTTTSIGIAVIEDGSMTVGEVLIAADLAMYEAKESGRDKAAFFSPERREKAGEPLTWSTRIRHSLEQDGFELHLQPILDLRSRSVTHHEVLVRMSDADGAIAPAAFLPVAERFGLITAIDRWVVHQAVQCVADVRAAGRHIVLEVNLSGKSVTDRELLDYIAAEITRAEIDPQQLIFEITETAAIANMAEAARFAQDLTALGCRFALDDFGAGFASFYYLKHLPLSFVKLDGDFIRSLPTSPTDQLLVRAMVEVARGLGMQTIAEFVGDAETVELLTTLGVDFAQGFHVGMPEPAQTALRASVPVGAP